MYAYLEDGVPIRSTGFFNHNALYEINIPQAGRIEIIKGPGTAVYGSDAVGGVVSVFTRDPSENPEAELFVEGGSSTYVRALGTASATFGRDAFRTRPQRHQRRRLARRLALRSAERHPPVGSSPERPGSPQDRRRDLPHRPAGRRGRRSHRRRLRERPVADLHLDRLPAGHGGPALERDPGTRESSRPSEPRCYARYNELDLLPSWQLGFDPQTWESKHQSLGLLTRYRHSLTALRTNLSTGVDLEYSPGSRLETQILPDRAGLVFTGYTVGEMQYDYDVSFYQVAPYAQADVALPARVNLSAGVRYDHLGYDYTNLLSVVDTGSHRRPASTDVSFDRLSPEARRHLGGRLPA